MYRKIEAFFDKIANINQKNVKQVLKILIDSTALKEIKRTGWVLKGVKNAESVADHTWGTSLVALLLAPPKLDTGKLLKLIVIHDLGEIVPGDVRWEKGKKVIGSQKEKRNKELEVLKNLFKDYPEKEKYLELLKDFNDQNSPEAKFLKQAEKFEMAIQAYIYEKQGSSEKSLDEFWENAEKYLEGKELEPYFRELQKMRKELSS